MYGVKIAGLGMSLPGNIVTNDMVAEMLLNQRAKLIEAKIDLTPAQMEEYETNDEWIRSRVGVVTRRFAPADKTTSDYGALAAESAWTDAYGDGLELPEFLIVATVSPDHFTTPPTAAVIQRKMKIPTHVGGHPHHMITGDVTLACSSLMTALTWGVSLIQS